ncbi:Delta-1-pyrroline-5-carboxylate dehydrogenase 12A1, mitochondrial [Vitis vinifera]|uniref:Delta-1-pyrroline-5-carboxylate dehydrogenase 12A1, mitochondrial n=1 Tax=Vitis vinifera TaxID=29760 RepID=A0A438I1F8_VITVI|nr:Delta-1-pyrroline-5-carboxylate dehydrogenase 12A1, mitochondrial [Vitis vinifera]
MQIGLDPLWTGHIPQDIVQFCNARCSKMKCTARISSYGTWNLSIHNLPFATIEVEEISGSQPAEVQNLGRYVNLSGMCPAFEANWDWMAVDLYEVDMASLQGKWTGSTSGETIVDPLNGEPFIQVAEVDETGIQPFVDSLSKCPKHGLHNPFKAPERLYTRLLQSYSNSTCLRLLFFLTCWYLMLGDISNKAAHMLSLPKVAFSKKDVSDFFTRLIQRVAPKSYQQALGEVYVTQKFLENFSGDQVRFLARSFAVPGNHLGQQSHGFRWPYGPVAIVTPFNFPLEIPVLQLMGALYMGNKPILKVDSKMFVEVVKRNDVLGPRIDQQIGEYCYGADDSIASSLCSSSARTGRNYCGCFGVVMVVWIVANPRMTLFTGSSRVADKLAVDLKGRIKLEDAGFDWKILGPDVQEVDYVAWVCDQDAYACSGQKCSAQSIVFMHENWFKSSLISRMKDLAARRKLEDLTIGPVLSFTTEAMLEHMNKLLQIPGSELLFGGKALENHSIPPIYGALKPTAIYIPLEEMLKDGNYELVTREIFGPFQVVTDYKDNQLPRVLEALERMHAHLTAAVEVIGKSVNGTTYAGLRARTTGAPQNHWYVDDPTLPFLPASPMTLSKTLHGGQNLGVMGLRPWDQFPWDRNLEVLGPQGTDCITLTSTN